MAQVKKAFSLPKVISFGLTIFTLLSQASASFPYYGTKIGSLKRLHHGVSGDVYAVDSRTIFIKSFNYDGEAPAAYFYVGNTNKPSNEGAHRLRDERGGTASLTKRYRNKDITLSLPEGKTLRDIKWFSVWCDEFAVNFGDVSIPNNLDFPRPQKITSLKGVHGVSSDNIVIVDAQTLLVPNFSYDGEAPDAKFWVGRGQRPSPQGLRIPDENGKENPLRRYDRKTIVLTLPGDLTIFDIGHFGVWCEAFTVDFGHVRIPEGLNVPPSLKMLGISPQSKLNCEVLYDDLAFEVRWAVAGESIVVQLVAKLGNNEYMSFGISPEKDRSVMIGADVVVAWVDKETGKGFAQDYYLDDKSQCSGGRGTCPDVNIKPSTNSIRLLNAAMVNDYSIVTYQRSLQAADNLDLPISVNGSQAIVWAIGPLNERKEASFHTHYAKQQSIDFGRQPTWNCPMPEGSKSTHPSDEDDEEDEYDTKIAETGKNHSEQRVAPKRPSEPEEEFYDNRAAALQRPTRLQGAARPVPTPKPVNSDGAWDIPAIQCYEPEDGVFYAQMGPTGGKHGYSAITGHVGWGISWYINGLLIPEIHVVRGKTYTFVVEGGLNPDIPAKYHPFYITDDPVGGYEHKREEEKKSIRIFAGVQRSRSGEMTPIGVGRLCNWTPDVDGPPADDYQSFGAYQRTLTLKCDPGEPGIITWKPDKNTPDTVYYHCFTHRYLGWKIHVHDSCDDSRYAASERHEIRLPATSAAEDYDAQSSIRHETKVSPNDNFLLKHQTDLIKNHNMNGTPPKLSFEITKSSEITKLISDGIRAAEALEESILRNSNGNTNTNTNAKSNTNDAAPVETIAYSVNQYRNSLPASVLPKTNGATGTRAVHSIQHQLAASDLLHGEKTPTQSSISHHSLQSTHVNAHIHSPNPPIHAKIHSPQYHSTLQNSQLIHQNAPHNSHNSHQHHHHHHHDQSNNLTNLPVNSQKPIGLSEFLRPPQNSPLFHPVKIPGRRPFPGPIKKNSYVKSVLPQQLPRRPSTSHLSQQAALLEPSAAAQPTLLVSHYHKPLPGLLKTFLKEKPFPLQPLAASVLLLGQPTEVGGKTHKTEPMLLGHKPKPIIPVPYRDLLPQDSLKSNVIAIKQEKKKPFYQVKAVSKDKPLTVPISHPPSAVFKKPFDIHEVKEEPSSIQIATMEPAVNKGFQPDTVVVESGFRPIVRRDSIAPDNIEQVASRREDPGSEIDEAMETDTLFLTAGQTGTQTQNFEPMFIPSPPDSTDENVLVPKPAPIQGFLKQHPILSDLPEMAELRNATLGDLLEDSKSQLFNEAASTSSRTITLRDSTEKTSLEIQQPTATKVNVTHPIDRMDENNSDLYDPLNENKSNDDDEHDQDQNQGQDDHDFPFEFDGMEEDRFEMGDKDDHDHEHELEDEYNDDDDDDDGDKEAQAAERIDTYYLPPDNRKIPHAQIPSGAVITYDGKSVIDNTLVLPPKLDARDVSNSRRQTFGTSASSGSRIAELIRSTPQFAPFRGEAPPPIAEFLSTEKNLPLNVSPLSNAIPTSPILTQTPPSSLPPSSATSLPMSSVRPISTKLQILNSPA